ncbi:hypothetical protein RFI_30304 [Reticulomyxa filosa]|uniref:Reverse transcriptase domain-containing protein n=1 Tax=Reticulomyxa filosa TaxID=46433 RepID=X6M0Z6_RETFI|nr:hypothetical protein RFI_30304 [Reticulomyxa filosa]|eukprot:ETO07087.1 hypothetical protein RFI_30304 [Reticulomyxa filosa]
MKLELKPITKHIKHKSYTLNKLYQEEVKRQVTKLEQKGIIRKSSYQFAAPVLLVKKKGYSLRMCVDYRKLNQATIRDEWPLPNINDLLKNCRRNEYFQISTYVIHIGDIYDVDMYIDDILVATETEEKHLEVLSNVFCTFNKYNIRIAMDKCEFFQHELIFLGQVLYSQGVSDNPKYINKVEYTEAKDKKAIKTSVRTDILTNELNKLRRKQAKWNWTDTHEHAFKQLKDAIENTQLLRYPKQNEDITYFLGNSSHIPITKNLSSLFKLSGKQVNSRLSRWAILLSEFSFEARYFLVRDNTIADFLSRHPTSLATNKLLVVTRLNSVNNNSKNVDDNISQIQNAFVHNFIDAQNNDNLIASIKRYFKNQNKRIRTYATIYCKKKDYSKMNTYKHLQFYS